MCDTQKQYTSWNTIWINQTEKNRYNFSYTLSIFFSVSNGSRLQLHL